MEICVIADNEVLYNEFRNIIKKYEKTKYRFSFFYSELNLEFKTKYNGDKMFLPISLKQQTDELLKKYDLFLSLHCKQIFPQKLVENCRCINIHPGFNPYNRGYFSQAFSIINKKPVGVTIHEMDKELDHGPIIVQKEVEIESSDTSYDVYKKIQVLEVDLLTRYIDKILNGSYELIYLKEKGNMNKKSDFIDLCRLDKNRIGTFGEFIDVLRATTFLNYNNAFFYNENGEKVYVSIQLKKQNEIL